MTTAANALTRRTRAGVPSRSVRLAWLIPGGLLAIASLLWGTFNVLSVLAHEEHSTTTSFAADGVASLHVATENGSVRIDTGDVSTIIVTADISSGWKESEVDQQVVDGVLRLRGTCPWIGSPWCSVDFTVTVPPDRSVVVDGSNGAITVRNTTGAVDVDNENGSITLDGLTGRIRVASDNGSITGRRLTSAIVDANTDNGRVDLSFAEPPDSVTGRTSNGRIEIAVPDTDVAYRVDMRTANGSTDNGVRTDPVSDHIVDLQSDNGSIIVRPSR